MEKVIKKPAGKRTKKEQKPIMIFTLDTETRDGLAGKIFRVGLFWIDEKGEKNYLADNSFRKIKKILLTKSITHEIHIYIHVLDFDFSKIVKEFKFQLKFLPSLFINGRTVKMATRSFLNKDGSESTIYFHDSFSLFPKPLDLLCKDFGLEAGKLDIIKEMPESYYEYYPNGRLNESRTKRNYFDRVDPLDPLLNKYLQLDCSSLFEIVDKAIKISGLKVKRFTDCPTTASLSMTIFRELFPDQFDHATQTNWSGAKNEMVEWFLRRGYYGGRTELFKHEQRGGWYIDKNSMYPHCMRKYLFPVGEFRDYEGSMARSCFELFCFDEQGGGMIEAKVFIPKMKYGVLPYRAKDKGNKLIFPCGTIEGVWTFHELKFAMDRGVEILNVKRAIFFPEMSAIFIGFVNYFEQLKKDNTETFKGSGVNEKGEPVNESLREWAKLILNSLYGKFSSRRERESYTSISEIDETIKKLKHKKNDRYYQRQIEFFEDVQEIGGVEAEESWIAAEEEGFFPMHFYHSDLEEEIFKYNSYLEADYIQVQISAYITSYARMELYEAIEWIEQHDGEVAYCDTDSLMSDLLLPAEMLHKSEFGKWDVEHEIDHVELIAEKMYGLKNKKGDVIGKGKGNPKQKIKQIEMDQWKEMREQMQKKEIDSIPIVTAEDGIQQKISFLSALKNDKDFSEVKMLEKSIQVRNRLPKRNFLPDGSSEPFFYEEGECEQEINQELQEWEINGADELEREEFYSLENTLQRAGKIKIPDHDPELYFYFNQLKKKTQKQFFSKNGMPILEWSQDHYDCFDPLCVLLDMRQL